MPLSLPRIVAACSLKSGGTTTLLMTLASAALAEGRAVRLIDMTRNRDLSRWALRRMDESRLAVSLARTPEELEDALVAGLKSKALMLIDPGTKPEKVRLAARYADLTLIPVRFSPLSAYWAAETDEMLNEEAEFGRARRRFFVATAIAVIPSRVARQVEARIMASASDRLGVGLGLRAAHEAPFAHGSTIFEMTEEMAPGLDKARGEALALAREIGIVPRAEAARPAAAAIELARPLAEPSALASILAPYRPDQGAAPFTVRDEARETEALVPA